MRPIRKPDTETTDPEYWERVLETHGLGIRQLGLQEEVILDEDTISLEELKHE